MPFVSPVVFSLVPRLSPRKGVRALGTRLSCIRLGGAGTVRSKEPQIKFLCIINQKELLGAFLVKCVSFITAKETCY